MTVSAGVAAIRGTYSGSCTLQDLRQGEGLTMKLKGSGAPGTIDATVLVGFTGSGEQTESDVRRRRGRRRHDRRRRPADAHQRLAPDGGGVLRQRGEGHRQRAARRGHLGRARGPRRGAGLHRVRAPVRRVRRWHRRWRQPVLPHRCRGRRCAGARRGDRGRAAGPSSMSGLTVEATAREQARAIREREISAREFAGACTWTGSPSATPSPNAIVSLDEERARAGALAADEALASGKPVGPLHGLPFAFKDTHTVAGWRTTFGSPLYADHVPDHDEFARRAGPRGRCGDDRQDQRAGVRGRLAHLQHRLRHDPQPGRPVPVGGRVQRGSGLRPRRGHGAARGRLRHGRLAAQPRVLLRRRRDAAQPGPGARVAALQPVGDHLGRRPDGPQRRRPGAAALRARRPRPAGPARARRPRLDLRRAGTRRPARAPRRRQHRPRRRLRRRPPGGRGGGRGGTHVRRRGCAGRVVVPGPGDGRRHLPHPARLAHAGQSSGPCWSSTPTRSRPRSPTTSAPAHRSPVPTSRVPTPSGPRSPRRCGSSSPSTTC
nr:amidase family protein [Nocardioides convexus]